MRVNQHVPPLPGVKCGTESSQGFVLTQTTPSRRPACASRQRASIRMWTNTATSAWTFSRCGAHPRRPSLLAARTASCTPQRVRMQAPKTAGACAAVQALSCSDMWVRHAFTGPALRAAGQVERSVQRAHGAAEHPEPAGGAQQRLAAQPLCRQGRCRACLMRRKQSD